MARLDESLGGPPGPAAHPGERRPEDGAGRILLLQPSPPLSSGLPSLGSLLSPDLGHPRGDGFSVSP